MMSGIFPRHIIEHFSTTSEAVPERMGQLARTHEGVTILFMDIVGGCEQCGHSGLGCGEIGSYEGVAITFMGVSHW